MVQNRGINQDVTQEMNRSLLLKNLRREGMCSRAYLASLTGLKQATVTNIMKDFLNWGIVTEVGFLNGSKGRRSIGVSINPDRYRVIGVRLARKHYSVGLFDLTGTQITKKRVDFKPEAVSYTHLDVYKRQQNELHLFLIAYNPVGVPAYQFAKHHEPEKEKYCCGKGQIDQCHIAFIGNDPDTQNIKAGCEPDNACKRCV